MTVGAVIVAAGLSSRMGDFKPLLKLEGRTLIEREVSLFLECGAQSVVVVTGHRAGELEDVLHASFPASEFVTTVYNSGYQKDMFRSVQLGAAALPDNMDFFYFLPSDCPCVSQTVVQALLDAAETGNAPYYMPICGGRRGHPPLIARQLIPPLLAYHGEGGLKQFLQQYPGREVPVDDGEILRDVDTPQDYQELKRQHSQP